LAVSHPIEAHPHPIVVKKGVPAADGSFDFFRFRIKEAEGKIKVRRIVTDSDFRLLCHILAIQRIISTLLAQIER
jgi:hypothetical protein